MTFRHLRNVRGFFSDYYLGTVFGRTGRRRTLSDRDTDLAYRRFMRIRERAAGRTDDAAATRERFLRPLLRDVLGLHLGTGEDRVHPSFASAEAEAGGACPLLLVYAGAWDEDLDGGAGGPGRRLGAALARAGLRHGLLASGEELRLLRAQGDGPAGAYLAADLEGLAEDEDPESFAALVRLLSATNFAPDTNGKLPIDDIERESRTHAEKVSEDLKAAVFAAAEALVRGLLADAAERGIVPRPAALADDELVRYRDAALTAIYRILFIFYAEARDPRLEAHRLYRDSYSMQGLLDDLVRDPTRDWPENRSTLWARLRALFHIYHFGLPAITPWEHIPPRGGDFFDPTTSAGRLLDETRLPDRAVARLVLALATTAPRRGVGRERVSFRELDIESLGAVYEGLLEFEPRVASETTVELRVQGRLFALPPAEVVRLCAGRQLALTGDAEIAAGTVAETVRRDADAQESEADEDDDAGEDDDEEEGAEAVRRGATARLVRRLEPGDFHFVPGPARKGSGSFYTPLPLVQDIVRHVLGPLVKGRTASEIERLRVVDPASGSAHFLVEAMRFLGQALHRAYVAEYGAKGPPEFRSTTGAGWDDACDVPDAEARAANSEARAWCKRRIAERCLFGVDINPTAVALARVALWIESLAGDRPLTYFEHHVRPGNSLLGTWLERLDQPPLPDMGPAGAGLQRQLFVDPVRQAVLAAARTRALIDGADPEALRREGIDPESVGEQRFKEKQRRDAEATLAAARLLFDLRSASAFEPAIWAEWAHLASFAADAARLEAYARGRPWWPRFEAIRRRERFFHWQLEFPEVFFGERAGFDAVIGNPPWDKVLPAKHEFYARHDVLIRAYKGNELDARIRELHAARPGLDEEFAAYSKRTKTVAKILRQSGDFPCSEARTQAAHEDVAKYFIDRAARLVGQGGAVGVVAPSVVYNGDGCVGLRRLFLEEGAIERFYGFENRENIFPIHRSYKFVSLVFRRGAAPDGFEAAFMRHRLEELADGGPKPWMVRVTREEIRRLSPETLAFLEYRSPRDQEIVGRMHRERPTLGTDGAGGWGVEFVSWRGHDRIYNASEDKDLFTDPRTGRLFTPAAVLGREPRDVSDMLRRVRARGFWPVFEGKHIDQFLVGTKPVRWWLSVEAAERKYGRAPRRAPTLAFRETARNTDERTCIAAVLPAESAASHTLCGMLVDAIDSNTAAAVLNSLPFDYALRMRTAGTHVSFTYLRPMPVPPADVVNALPRLRTRLAWERGLGNITEDRAVWPDLWAINRAVAEAYDLDPEDFEHVLGTFPGFARKRAEFVAYLRERIAEWRSEGRRRRPYPTAEERGGVAVAAERPERPRRRRRAPRRASHRRRGRC